MTPSKGPWITQFTIPTRGVIVALGCLSASVSVIPAYWPLPVFAFLVLMVAKYTVVLAGRATPRFIASTLLACTLVVLPRGVLSFATARLDDMSELLPTLRATSTLIAVAGLAITALATWQIIAGRRPSQTTWLLVLFWVVGSASAAILVDSQTWIDVWHLHRDAGAALGQGVTPYDGRSVPNPMIWFPEGSMFEGYVYPPIVLYTYGLADLVVGDSRWIAVAAGAITWLILRRRSHTLTTDAVALLFLMSPGWALMAQLSWTEPLSIALLFLAFAAAGHWWKPVLVGIFIASKQYLLFWALPTAISWVKRKPQALLIAGATAILAYAVGLIYGAEGYIRWAFTFHLTAPDAVLGSGLPGMARMLFSYPLSIPGWLSVSLGLLVGSVVASRDPKSDASLLLAGISMMYVIFLTGSQAFPNYWYFIAGGLVLTLIEFAEDSGPGRDTSRVSEGQVGMSVADETTQ